MAKGKELESAIKNSLSDDMVYYRLKDAPKDFKSEVTRFTPSNIADCIIGNPHTKKLFWIEAKETKGSSLSMNNINYDHCEKMILQERKDFSEAWFIVRFTEKQSNTFFVHQLSKSITT